ncbi:MAG: Cysteine desulfurase [Candidatus Collierbacteria bacterium GW2011_GWF2_44_15]|uniref:cysteine desulfurase n=3 Tax=Candidatus Collieribacteriota TaxID=1752725 RepID=A0A0G1HKL5_9BACT|nr:MAG: Cysteine desulfurase [Candidatus Collierbacteria bacterium GW2011_GWA1_44_12]KKT47113.1 MAG: Cysteine desulfurase [Candidatus Collierbacteria bacterium GW2011_GWF2_44_15]KKT97526.1 MAG: Cysteine desulfurase [Candidatus Collierbacteria bacterium GW2011_GWC2_45_15]
MMNVEKIRNDFPILKRKIKGKDLVYLDSGATSQKPESVIKAIDSYYRESNANIHRGVYELSVESTRMVDESRATIATFLGARFEEIIFVRNASEALNLVAYSWGRDNIQKGDAIIVSKLEHHSNLIPWQELCREKGAELRVIEVTESAELNLENGKIEQLEDKGLRVKVGGLRDLIDDKVKLLAITGVSNVMGTITPLQEIIKEIRKQSLGVKVLVDGAQMVPHMSVDVKKLGADFLVFSGHKMLGPTGTGVLWGKKEVLEEMRPFLFGGDMINEVKLTGASWAGLPNKFEAGTPDIAGIVGLGAAVEYLKKIGMDNVRQHEKELLEYALKRFRELSDEGLVTVYGPENAEVRGGAIPFNVKGVHAHDTAQILDSFGIAVRSGQHCAGPLVTGFGVMAMARVTFYIYNTKTEIDYLIDKIREVPKVFI